MLKGENDTKKADEECIGNEERNKFLWNLRSDFAWVGRKSLKMWRLTDRSIDSEIWLEN